jgi:hypothetical protein
MMPMWIECEYECECNAAVRRWREAGDFVIFVIPSPRNLDTV